MFQYYDLLLLPTYLPFYTTSPLFATLYMWISAKYPTKKLMMGKILLPQNEKGPASTWLFLNDTNIIKNYK